MMDFKKRAVEVVAWHVKEMQNGDGDSKPPKEWPRPSLFAIILFMLTVLVFVVGMILFDYTFQVVKILTLVEDLPSDYDLAHPEAQGEAQGEDDLPPQYHDDEATAPVANGPPKIAPGLYIGGEPDASGKYITSSFRKTVKYLRQEGGFYAPWRGFLVNLVYYILASVVNGIFIGIFVGMFNLPLGKFLAGVLCMVVVSPLNLVHTHVVIAPPTKETWFGRLSRLPYKSIVATLPASLLVAVTGQITYALPELMALSFFPSGSDNPKNPYQNMLTPLQTLSIYSVFTACHVLLLVPSMIILYRVQASVYNVTEEAIVPFERTGPLSMLGAWKTWTWDGKKRLLRLYLIIMPLVWVASFIFGTVLFFEITWAVGDNAPILNNILKTWLKNQHGGSD